MPFENLVREGVYRFHPYFWKPLTCGYVAAGAFFLQKRAPYFSPDLGTDHEGTARKSAASRQGRNGRVFNKARNIGISDSGGLPS